METMLAVCWVNNGDDRCQVGFTSWNLSNHGDNIDGALAQVTMIYSADDVGKQKMQKVHKKFGFAKADLILEVGDATIYTELECSKARRFERKPSTE